MPTFTRHAVVAAPQWRHDNYSEQTIVTTLDRINLRLSAEMLDMIDAARSKRAGKVSRNTWIAEAIEEKLARDARQPESQSNERAS
jgi:metal-responsive CopG/Arc/MetJ family transcriptional regulator